MIEMNLAPIPEHLEPNNNQMKNQKGAKLIGTKRPRASEDHSVCDKARDILNPESDSDDMEDEPSIQIEKDRLLALQLSLQCERPKRARKPVVAFDDSPGSTPKGESAPKQVGPNIIEKGGKSSCLRNIQRAPGSTAPAEVSDPFSEAGFKQVIEPLFALDKLEVLREDYLFADIILEEEDFDSISIEADQISKEEKVLVVPNEESSDPASFNIAISLHGNRKEGSESVVPSSDEDELSLKASSGAASVVSSMKSPLDYANRKSNEDVWPSESGRQSPASDQEMEQCELNQATNIAIPMESERPPSTTYQSRVDDFWRKQQERKLPECPWDQRGRLKGVSFEQNSELLRKYHHCQGNSDMSEEEDPSDPIIESSEDSSVDSFCSLHDSEDRDSSDWQDSSDEPETISQEPWPPLNLFDEDDSDGEEDQQQKAREPETEIGSVQVPKKKRLKKKKKRSKPRKPKRPDYPRLIPIPAESPRVDELLLKFLKPASKRKAPITSSETKDQGEFKLRRDLASLEDIAHRFDHAYYHSLDFLVNDLAAIVVKALRERCGNQLARCYLTKLLLDFVAHIESQRPSFDQAWLQFYRHRMKANYNPIHPMIGRGDPKVWYSKLDESDQRDYVEINELKMKLPAESEESGDDYSFGFSDDEDEGGNRRYEGRTLEQQEELELIKQVLRTQKRAKCRKDCYCQEADETRLRKGKRGCRCAQLRTECSTACGCSFSSCQNRQLQKKMPLKLGSDLEERVAWGIDMCTAVNILSLLPRGTPRRLIRDWVEKKLMYAVQQQGTDGYDILKALDFIIKIRRDSRFNELVQVDGRRRRRYEQEDREVAQILKDGILNFPEKNAIHFKIHNKGLGIFCTREEGIDARSLVIEYLGEAYTQHHWFEKQDVIKQGQNEGLLNKELPDFYNFILERHLDDPDGYNLLTIDPILYGNYASRLSHSCSPNCQTLTKIQAGRYYIGMFTKAPIAYGEELSFDYCSSTESEKEFEDSVCLCGTVNCKGTFLMFGGDKKSAALQKQYHSFVDRNFLIFSAAADEELSTLNRLTLEKNGLRSIMNSRVPTWLQKWAALVCEYIEFEQIQFYIDQMEQPGAVHNEVKKNCRNSRRPKIQNICITVDKVAHVLRLMGESGPPVLKLSQIEIFKRTWKLGNSTRCDLENVLRALEDGPIREQCQGFIREIQDDLDFFPEAESSEEQAAQINALIRTAFLNIAATLRSSISSTVFIEPLADILHLIGSTKTWFTTNETYTRVNGPMIKIRSCDVRHGTAKDGTSVLQGFKEYDSQYIWGQLAFWFKQTVVKPSHALAGDRRGTISIPDLSSCVVGGTEQQVEDRSSPVQGSPDIMQSAVSPSPRSSDSGNSGNSTKESLACFSIQAEGGEQEKKAESQLKITPMPVSEAPLQALQANQSNLRYPSKRPISREDFLTMWPNQFSKPWDMSCGWHFKNPQKLYGSVQLESLLEARSALEEKFSLETGEWMKVPYEVMKLERYKLMKAFMNQRLEYFGTVVNTMLACSKEQS